MSNKKSVIHIFVTIVIILAIGVQSCSKVSRLKGYRIPLQRLGEKISKFFNKNYRKLIVFFDGEVNKPHTIRQKVVQPLYLSSKASKKAKEIVDMPVVKTRLISFFPSNEIQYKNVYGKEPSMSAKNKIRQFNKRLKSEKTVIKVGLDDVNKIFGKIESVVEEDTMVIIAHSTNFGQKIIFPNGKFMDIEKFHKKCIDIRKKCLVLTCYSHDFNFNTQISPLKAFSIWEAIKKKPEELRILRL